MRGRIHAVRESIVARAPMRPVYVAAKAEYEKLRSGHGSK
jgi:hypothetical protein